MLRFAGPMLMLCLTACCLLAAEKPTAIRLIEGEKTTFPEKAMPEGVKALRAVLESCHDINDETLTHTVQEIEDAKKAAAADEYIEFLFPQAIEVEVLENKLQVSEAVYAKGVFWVISGKDVMRCTKYEFDKMERFRKWYRQTLPVDR
jgi:hypothetical protein